MNGLKIVAGSMCRVWGGGPRPPTAYITTEARSHREIRRNERHSSAGCGKTLPRIGFGKDTTFGKGTTSVVPLSPLKSAALQRLRLAFYCENKFSRTLFGRAFFARRNSEVGVIPSVAVFQAERGISRARRGRPGLELKVQAAVSTHFRPRVTLGALAFLAHFPTMKRFPPGTSCQMAIRIVRLLPTEVWPHSAWRLVGRADGQI